MQKMTDKVLAMVSIAGKAGKIASGEFSVEKAVKSGKAKLVIVAKDASDNTRKLFNNACAFYKVPIIEYSNKTDLGHCIGKDNRASVCILDEGLANAILKKIDLA